MTLGSNIQKLRKEAHLSQEEFAERFHVTRQTISNWENSKSYPDLETIIKISDSFEISLDVLLKEDMTMVKTIDNEVKSTRKYARALIAITAVLVLLIGSFGIYSIVYVHTKNNLEHNFEEQLKNNDFYKNTSGYYSMDFKEGIQYAIPNQSMPGLFDFSLHFHAEHIWCYVNLGDAEVEITWSDYNDFYAASISQDTHKVLGSTAGFEKEDYSNMKKLGDELGISEKEITEIIAKGNELYKKFY